MKTRHALVRGAIATLVCAGCVGEQTLLDDMANTSPDTSDLARDLATTETTVADQSEADMNTQDDGPVEDVVVGDELFVTLPPSAASP